MEQVKAGSSLGPSGMGHAAGQQRSGGLAQAAYGSMRHQLAWNAARGHHVG